MDIIKEFGNYEKASKSCDREIKDGGYPYDLIQALLEYRREHGIYEVRDKVVLPNRLYMDAIQEITHINNVHGLYGYSDGCCGYPTRIRHATDEEIKANKRLD